MSALFTPEILLSILTASVGAATIILFAALGELITERAGIWNMGVEGTMLCGCLAAYVVMSETGSPAAAAVAAVAAAMARARPRTRARMPVTRPRWPKRMPKPKLLRLRRMP